MCRPASPCSDLETNLGLARTRYRIATERFAEVFADIPSDLPHPDSCKQLELVARERNLAMQELAEATRKWTDFLIGRSRPNCT